ncbi:methionyl-tRNA synthetase [Mycoplasmopsis mustelae]|uniref:Methionine--tRNA ligase n=1 Tax=Mycoplasmopsis mustelae TaxID=171289 RepID=A0A4R7UE07_9BACT|nr:methionine--tRNA ligase [Mycoplasmopsis mustelae]TDV24161.1 methionyl-tRNA synthetase [Mycoplasmopsis mustelae]
MKKFYITTPIYYASGNLHIGHLFTTTLAWAIANYKKARGYDVKMLTGSDEHGQKIQQVALQHQMQPQQFVDMVVEKFKAMWVAFDINYDFFSRTTALKHQNIVRDIFSYFLKQGYIYKGKYQGWYSVSDEEFLTEAQAVKKAGKFYHPTSGHELILVSEESYFFDMKRFQGWLIDYIKSNPDFIFPKKTEQEMLSNFLNQGLDDLSVTRTNIDWGIKINEDAKHTLYVWLDALCNYITALGFDIKNPSTNFLKYWDDEDTEIVHILGKEIARFHMIYWPIFLKALNIKQPTRIQTHGWILTPQGKMSKSKGNVVDPFELLKKYHPEMIKYFFVSQFSLGDDLIFDENRFIDVINADLVNNYGNLISRTLKMIHNSFNQPLKYQHTNLTEDLQLETAILESKKTFITEFDNYQIHKAYVAAMNLSNQLNKYIDLTKPWTLKDDFRRLEQILNRLLNGIYAVSVYLKILLPKKVSEVAQGLNVSNFNFDVIDDFNKFDRIFPKQSFILFERIKK